MREKFDIPLITFSVLVSAFWLVASTANYAEFYRALREVDMTDLEVTVSVSENNANITVAFNIENPTGYRGLSIREITCQLYYEDENANANHTFLWWHFQTLGTPLDPYSKVPFAWNVTPQEAAELKFINYFEAHQGSVNWKVTCGVILNTFLGSVENSMSKVHSL